MEMSPAFVKALRAFTGLLPERVAQLRQVVAEAHARCAAFDAASATCLQVLLAFFQEENRRKTRYAVFPEHIASWSPQLDAALLDEFVIQHALLERLFRCAFPDALAQNRLACEIAKVLAALAACGYNRGEFLAPLNKCYLVVEQAIRSSPGRRERQEYLSTFCEQFITAFDRGQAEEFSLICTPQEIVQYMSERVEQELDREFGASLSSPGVAVLDPCCGIGLYTVYVLGRIGREMLPYKYRHELFAIEIMLLPAYIARLNIEQAFTDIVGWYEPFQGLRYASALA